eukprot:PhF_6_TR9226/c0_g1_i5/m.14519
MDCTCPTSPQRSIHNHDNKFVQFKLRPGSRYASISASRSPRRTGTTPMSGGTQMNSTLSPNSDSNMMINMESFLSSIPLEDKSRADLLLRLPKEELVVMIVEHERHQSSSIIQERLRSLESEALALRTEK